MSFSFDWARILRGHESLLPRTPKGGNRLPAYSYPSIQERRTSQEMGQRGPAPKPTQIKVLQGTFRPDRSHGEVFPDVSSDLSPPDHLSEPAHEKWLELAPVLTRNGLLSECDLDTLALYCETWVRWRTTEEALQREGMTTTAQSGYKQVSPYYTIASKSQAELRALADRLGMNPSARTRIETAPVEKSNDGLLA